MSRFLDCKHIRVNHDNYYSLERNQLDHSITFKTENYEKDFIYALIVCLYHIMCR